jgi:hypothetical protein
VDSRLLARHIGIQHKNVIESIGKYREQFLSFGKVAFQTAPLPTNEKFVHMNLNKLVNKTAGIGSGQRDSATLPTRSMLVTAQMIAAAAMRGAGNHREGYEKAKAALTGLGGLMKLNAEPAAGSLK